MSLNQTVGRRSGFSQGSGLDVLTALAVAASQVLSIHVGSAVVPIRGRHPSPMAQQALTVASAAGEGRFSLGIGVTHAGVSEGWYGIDYRTVVDLCEEHVPALADLLSTGCADHAGDRLVARARIEVTTPRPGLYLGALAPRMLALAGSRADGTSPG